ncbi:fused MFS/spermidine synthase [Luteolibacter arcticus]|uniref:Fused MFS/spermidine synthase n=1 Tax=Luteolibacter arcticus TaxID=1581411 RepID=A0ABT3GI96_9BACT|nr:fused MFS/spermidine synthase [Luteolibacter arcticus]MCW1923232.1 fused MFS/spermidine synthase [Luteolibacter arcticus]
MPARRAPLFTLTLFLGAALLFLIQLVFARMVLPLLGGAPAVWNTAMVFYQAVLLAGYGYAHWLTSRAGRKWQLGIHALVLVAGLACLPFAVPANAAPPGESNPVPWLIGVLAIAVGLPFFAVSATSPVLQHWFSKTGHPDADDPYFLYAASNAGSLAGLLGYPLLVEPHLTLGNQAWWWMAGYALLALGVMSCGWRSAGGPEPAGVGRERITGRRRLRWVLCALVPSSLMLSVTSYLSSEIAAVPLLWVLPLALFLATFMVVFARRPVIPHRIAKRALPLVLVGVVMVLAIGATTPMSMLAALHLLGFFIAALVCHGELAKDRPGAASLTEFYFWMSLGGVLGGAFNALLAPVIFDRVLEYPLMLVAAAWLGLSSGKAGWRDLAWAAVPMVLALALVKPLGLTAAFGGAAVACFLLSRHGARFALGLAGVLLVAGFTVEKGSRVLLTERSFFGIHRVEDDGRLRRLFHGKTIHGLQDTARPQVPLSYYHPEGPLGQIFAAGVAGPVGAVGLGAGALAAYGKPGQVIDFYEIDPAVARIAADPRYFSYLSGSPAKVSTILGDARLMLAKAPDARYELLVLDAYGSDSVPVHLLTREALQLYLRKLAPGGRIAFQVSNLHLNLRPVVASLAHEAGLVCLAGDDEEVTDEEVAAGRFPSRWMIVARRAGDFGALPQKGNWEAVEGDTASPLWTDDHSSILPLLDFRLR